MDADCRRAGDGSSPFARLARRSWRERIPINGSIELTRRCNLDCIHCYAGDRRAKTRSALHELSADQWKRILDEVADAGCLFLIFTGGEALFRSDFPEIYRHACENGMLTTVFTNGFQVGDNALEALVEYPPHAVEITVYGGSSRTYGQITGHPEAYETCLGNMDRLIEAGVSVKTKTVLMKHNFAEFEAIGRIAEQRGLKFRFDAALFPRLNGDRTPLDARISVEQAADAYLSTPARRMEWVRLHEKSNGGTASGCTYLCGAGRTGFHIDFSGKLQPCVLVDDVGYDLLEGPFIDGWSIAISELLEKSMPLDFECAKCDIKCLCSYCPAFFRLENGSEHVKSKYLCDVGREIAKRLKNEIRRTRLD